MAGTCGGGKVGMGIPGCGGWDSGLFWGGAAASLLSTFVSFPSRFLRDMGGAEPFLAPSSLLQP